MQPFGVAHVLSINPLMTGNRVYEVQVQIDKSYFGYVTFSLIDHVFGPNAERLKLQKEQSLRFKRVRVSAVQHSGYIVRKVF